MIPLTAQDLEWLRSPEAASRGVTAEEIAASEELSRRGETVAANIKSAFGGYTLGDGIGLWEADAWDSCVDPERPRMARMKDEREDWQRLSSDDLYRCSCALNFTDALGYRFLLPAFMLADMDSGIDELIVIHLSITREDRHGTRTLLSCDQINSVIQFLELFLDDPDCDFHHQSIKEALAAFWRPLLEQQSKKQNKAEMATPRKPSD
jgi:hypothetical protein